MLSLLALASSACWGTSDFFAGLKSRTMPPAAVVGWSQGLALLAIAAVVALRPAQLTFDGWPAWAVAAGLAGSMGLVCFYAALSTGTMGVVAPVASLGSWSRSCSVSLAASSRRRRPGRAWRSPSSGAAGLWPGAVRRGLSPARHPRCVAAVGFGFALFCLDAARVSPCC